MLKKILLMGVIIMLVNLAVTPSLLAADKNGKDTGFISKLKSNIEKQGTGTDSKIKVKLVDGTKLEGYVSEIRGGGFSIVNKTTGQKVEVEYPQVKQAQGNHWSVRKGLYYGAIIGLAVIAVAIIVALNNDK